MFSLVVSCGGDGLGFGVVDVLSYFSLLLALVSDVLVIMVVVIRVVIAVATACAVVLRIR